LFLADSIEIDEMGSFQFGVFSREGEILKQMFCFVFHRFNEFQDLGFETLRSRCRIVDESGPVELGVWHILPEAVQILHEYGN